MNDRLKRARAFALRAFLIYCVLYTVTSVLFDHRGTTYVGISESACSPQYIGSGTFEDIRQTLIDEFAPTFVFSAGEPADLQEEVIVPYQLVADPDDPSRYVWRGAVAYPTDYGATSFGVRLSFGNGGYSVFLSKSVLRALGWIFGQAHLDSHVGDVEMFSLYLKPAPQEGYWMIDGLTTYPHGNRKFYSPEDVRCFRDSPLLYISRGKHAMYPSLQECNNASVVQQRRLHLMAEHCSIGELYYPITLPEFDVGDSANPINIFETSPTLRRSEVFQGEDAWGDCFWGGHGADDDRICRARFRWW